MSNDEKFPVEIQVMLIVLTQFTARVVSEALPPASKERIVEELKQCRDMVKDPAEAQKVQETFGFSVGDTDETPSESVQRGRAAFKGMYEALIQSLSY